MDQQTQNDVIVARPVELPVARSRAGDSRADGSSVGDSRPDFSRLAMLDPRQLSPRGAMLDFCILLIAGVMVHYLPPLMIFLATGDPFAGMAERGAGIEGAEAAVVAGKWIELLLIAAFAAYFVLRNGLTTRNLGLHLDSPERQLGWAVLTLIGGYAYLIGSAVFFLAGLMLTGSVESETKQRMEFMKQLPIDSMGHTVLLLIAVAFHEELLFRGLMLPLLKRATGHWWSAVLISSCIFGTLHFTQGVMAMAQITGLAVVLSLFFLWSRSLLAVSIAHFAFNFLQIQLMKVFQDFAPELMPTGSAPVALG